MLEGGEDPVFIARRLAILASEDIGNADPRALQVAMNAKEAVEFIGMPEAPSSEPIVPGERPSDACDLLIVFHSKRARELFARWMCRSGEQQYWEWMEYRETEESGDITVAFDYHPIVRPDLPRHESARYGEFIADGIVRTRVIERRREVDTERNLALSALMYGK
jgi:hypothetical protein